MVGWAQAGRAVPDSTCGEVSEGPKEDGRGCGGIDGKDWTLSEMLSKDMTEASKIMATLEEVDRLVCGSVMHRNWQENLRELVVGQIQGHTVPCFIGGGLRDEPSE